MCGRDGESYIQIQPPVVSSPNQVFTPSDGARRGRAALLGSEAQTTARFTGAAALGLPSQPQLIRRGPQAHYALGKALYLSPAEEGTWSRGEHRGQRPAVSDSVTLMEWFLAKSIDSGREISQGIS